MEAKLIINGVDFSQWAKSGGIKQSTIERQGREVVTLNGTRFYTSVKKRGISYEAVELRDNTLVQLISALQTNPATVTYTDQQHGDSWVGTFYVSGISAKEKIVTGGNTYWNGFSFDLEER